MVLVYTIFIVDKRRSLQSTGFINNLSDNLFMTYHVTSL